ncbi:MAG: hypothetical protein ABS938_14430 [Psychrobacillus psychrodurans]
MCRRNTNSIYASPNVRRDRPPVRLAKDVQTMAQVKKATKDQHTGFYGLFSPRSKRFVFGIQEESQTAVEEKAKKRLGKRGHYDFDVRKIRYRNAADFNDGLRKKGNDGISC